MKTNILTLLVSSILLLCITTTIYLTQYSNENFVIKGVLFLWALVIYLLVFSFLRSEYIVYSIVFISFLNIPIGQFYTSSTNVFIVVSVLFLFVRAVVTRHQPIQFNLIKNSSLTWPAILIITSYTISLAFAGGDLGEHFKMYHSVIFAALLSWLIIGTVYEKRQIVTINYVLLLALVMNLGASVLFYFFPDIADFRDQFFSLYQFAGEAATRLKGLSFKGEGYGEYLMICAVWLFAMLLNRQLHRWKWLYVFIAICTVAALMLNRSRGGVIILIIGALFYLVATKTVTPPRKIVVLLSAVLIFGGALWGVEVYSTDVTLVDRFYELTDESQYVGSIPATRYYTWVPGLQHAKHGNFLGGGPSFSPYITADDWTEIVADGGRGEIVSWPHNITILVLCTVGVYGLLSYMFLVYRIVGLRKTFKRLGPYLQSCYSAYFLCFMVFLIEGQKYDGVLRHPGSNFYFISILIALLFTSENINKAERLELQKE